MLHFCACPAACLPVLPYHRDACSCVVDMQPHKMSAEQLNTLANFAEMVIRHVEKDHYIELKRRASPALGPTTVSKPCILAFNFRQSSGTSVQWHS